MAQVRALAASLALPANGEIVRAALVAGCALALIFAGQAAPL
jgi:hypothetical protein